jgi:hypothetical protein
MVHAFDGQWDIAYHKSRLKVMPIHSRSIVRAIVPALMLVLLLASMTISAHHDLHGCENPHACAICMHQLSNYALPGDAPSESEVYQDPVLFLINVLPKRVSHPFHTLVFASHAPPQFC